MDDLRWGRPVGIALALGLLLAGSVARATNPWEGRDCRGGVIYLSLAPELEYDPNATFRDLSGLPPPSQAITRGNVGETAQIAHVLVAFPPESRPNLNFVTFGVEYDPGIEVLRFGATPAKCIQMASRDWPMSREGTCVGWTYNTSDTNRVVEVGWLALRAKKPGKLRIVPNPDPNLGCRLVSPNPPDQVPAAGWGILGFGQDGMAPEPSFPGPVLGAACYTDTLCLQVSRAEAEYHHEVLMFLGEGLSCGPETNCRADAPTGACCLPDGSCAVLSRKECVRNRGTYVGNETKCEARPCDDKGTRGAIEGRR